MVMVMVMVTLDDDDDKWEFEVIMEMWCIFTQDEVTPGQRGQSGLHCNYCTRYSVPVWNWTVCSL